MASSRRLRLSLGSALIAILVIALIFGLVAHVRREAIRERLAHKELALQESVTPQVLSKARTDLMPPGVSETSSQMGVGSSYMDWHTTMRVVGKGRDMIDLEVRGSMQGSELRPIRIIPRKGELHAEIIRKLTEEYRKRKWAYVIESGE